MDATTLYGSIIDIIQNENTSPSRGLLVARLGSIIVRKFPHLHWSHYGFLQLSELLQDMRQRGLLTLGAGTNGALTVWTVPERGLFRGSEPDPAIFNDRFPLLKPNSFSRTESNTSSGMARPGDFQRSASPVPIVPGFRRLRSEAWYAFTTAASEVTNYCNKKTGVIQRDPGNPEDEWILITPIGVEKQKEWAASFLAACRFDGKNGIEECLKEPDWYHAIIVRLQDIHSSFVSAWKRFRSGKVAEFVEVWCEAKEIDCSELFEPVHASPVKSIEKPTTIPSSSPRGLREALIASISKMDTNDLLELKIPARILIECLQPELLKMIQ